MKEFSTHDIANFLYMAKPYKIYVVEEGDGLGQMYRVKIKLKTDPWYEPWKFCNFYIDLIKTVYDAGLLKWKGRTFLIFGKKYLVVPD